MLRGFYTSFCPLPALLNEYLYSFFHAQKEKYYTQILSFYILVVYSLSFHYLSSCEPTFHSCTLTSEKHWPHNVHPATIIPPPIYSCFRPAVQTVEFHLRVNSTLEDLVWLEHKKNLAEIICRFADALALLTYIGVMIQELWWSGVFGGLLGLWLTPESGHVVCMSSLFRLPHTLCRYHPYTGINTRCLFLLSLPAWHVCVCVCRGSCMSFACLWASSLISPLRLTDGNKIQHHCNIQIPAPWHDFDMLPVSTIFSKHCHHSLEPAGSQMNKSVLVWVPHHFYWLVATCFCCCYMA